MDREFKAAYRQLNDQQRLAVDAIDGPLLVVAGPGTGKTQILSLRVANILRQTDALASNILCLTFTESARLAMQDRLTRLIGPQASQVAVHTFHSFGSHIIGTHGDYFQEAFGFRPSDDVTRYEILADILKQLPNDNSLSGQYDGQFYYLKDIQARISQLKQAGLTPDLLDHQLRLDKKWVNQANKAVKNSLNGLVRVNLKDTVKFDKLLNQLPSTFENAQTSRVKPLGWLCLRELETALEAASERTTKPLTAWKNRWLTKDGDNDFKLKASAQIDKLLSLAEVYQSYQISLAKRRLYDYDDMIMRLLNTLGQSADLKAELQEQYQYIMVDEYQDTNGAQLQLLEQLASNPINEQRPNLMVVGDDDQAIYGFQGAHQSSMIDFLNRWPTAKTVVLTTNYRSIKPVVAFNRQLIIQGQDRLENKVSGISKQLSAHKTGSVSVVKHNLLPTEVEQFGWLASEVKNLIERGHDPRQIAVIAPRHKHLEAIVPYLQELKVAIAYERREDVLQQLHVWQLIQLSRLIVYLASNQPDQANQLLPEVLSYPWWGIDSGWLWELSLKARQAEQPWLELMRRSPHRHLKQIAEWLIEAAKASHSTPLEPMMDELMGPAVTGRQFASPYRQYYFGHDSVNDSVAYLRLLSGLISLRTALRQYQPKTALKLADLVAFADLRTQADLPLLNDHPLVLDAAAVQLLTAHKAKGLEFDHVYLLNVDESTWSSGRSRNNNIALPLNYSVIAPAGDNLDEKLRLFYVAASRAREQLTLLSYEATNDGQPSLPLGWLQTKDIQQQIKTSRPNSGRKPNTKELANHLGFDWLTPHFEIRTRAPWRALLQEQMLNYQLSPTHLTAFLDVSRGGPKAFLVNQLLRFPQALSVSQQFGDVMHELMRRLHGHFNHHGKLPAKKLAQNWLDEIITAYYFGPIEEPRAQRRGRLSIDAIYSRLKLNFNKNQLAEYDFAGEGVVIGEARLKGIIDCLEIDKTNRSAQIVDYKTGSAITKWPSGKTKFDDYKAHRFRQQLMFYKLLVENSISWSGYQVEQGNLTFIETDKSGKLASLDLVYDEEEIEQLQRLIQVVYRSITALQLPDTSSYSPDFAGTLAFEADLLK